MQKELSWASILVTEMQHGIRFVIFQLPLTKSKLTLEIVNVIYYLYKLLIRISHINYQCMHKIENEQLQMRNFFTIVKSCFKTLVHKNKIQTPFDRCTPYDCYQITNSLHHILLSVIQLFVIQFEIFKLSVEKKFLSIVLFFFYRQFGHVYVVNGLCQFNNGFYH